MVSFRCTFSLYFGLFFYTWSGSHLSSFSKTWFRRVGIPVKPGLSFSFNILVAIPSPSTSPTTSALLMWHYDSDPVGLPRLPWSVLKVSSFYLKPGSDRKVRVERRWETRSVWGDEQPEESTLREKCRETETKTSRKRDLAGGGNERRWG